MELNLIRFLKPFRGRPIGFIQKVGSEFNPPLFWGPAMNLVQNRFAEPYSGTAKHGDIVPDPVPSLAATVAQAVTSGKAAIKDAVKSRNTSRKRAAVGGASGGAMSGR